MNRAVGIVVRVAGNLVRGSGPCSRFEVLLWHAVGVASFLLVVLLGLHLVGPLLRVPPRPAIVTLDGEAYLPDEELVAKVFNDLAAAESAAEILAKEAFPDHRWSQQDKRAEIMSRRTRKIAKHHKINVTLAYLIHQRGIREHWPGKDGKPLEVQIVPRASRNW